MFPIYRADNITDAQFLVDRLEAHGIPCLVRNAALQGALGELPMTARPEVCVMNQADVEPARALAREHEAVMRAGAPKAERTCEVCGQTSPENFDLCWSCRRPFDAP